ncbi:MAG TPA: D-alanine--D-alanine ligase [Paenibacillaceae bacterium]|nr:D-alanine--D-alanine ligase [Paenibacillaceae bacterium]
MSKKQRLGIIYGGKSSEHEVSIHTALSVMNAVNKEQYEVIPIYINMEGQWVQGPLVHEMVESIEELRLTAGVNPTPNILGLKEEFDMIFPVIHGPNGEDGTLQGLLELMDVPYVGSGVLGSSLGMDKIMMKEVYGNKEIPQGKYRGILRSDLKERFEDLVQEIENDFGYPCFIKPANMGSSVGISKAKDQDALREALKLAERFDRKIIVEEFINGRELEIGVLGNDRPETSVVGEITFENEFYDYEAKYKGGGTRLTIPAQVPDSVVSRMKDLAVKAFLALDCSGLSRVDFFWDVEKDQLYINEINTLPGFTPFSMYPMMWKEAGKSYEELINTLIALGLERYREKKENQLVAEKFTS